MTQVQNMSQIKVLNITFEAKAQRIEKPSAIDWKAQSNIKSIKETSNFCISNGLRYAAILH